MARYPRQIRNDLAANTIPLLKPYIPQIVAQDLARRYGLDLTKERLVGMMNLARSGRCGEEEARHPQGPASVSVLGSVTVPINRFRNTFWVENRRR